MPVDIQSLYTKAADSVRAIEQSTPKEREKVPAPPFVEDYNRIRAMAIELKPDLATLMPPHIEILDGYPLARYVELLAYLRQILSFLDTRNHA